MSFNSNPQEAMMPMRKAALVVILGLWLVTTLASAQVVERAAPDNPMVAGALEGQRAAEQVGTGGYFAGGMVSGVFPGLIGTGIAYAVAATSDVQIPATTQAMIASNGWEYVLSYEQAFRDRVKARRKSSALTGGLLGTAVAVMIYVTAVN